MLEQQLKWTHTSPEKSPLQNDDDKQGLEEISLQAHSHRDILKTQDPSQIILGSRLLVFSSPISPLLIPA